MSILQMLKQQKQEYTNLFSQPHELIDLGYNQQLTCVIPHHLNETLGRFLNKALSA